MPNFKNERPVATPEGFRNPVSVRKNLLPSRSKFVSATLNGGMITSIDPADLNPAALQYARNARVRFDRTQRRAGLKLLTPVKPNSDPVMSIDFHKMDDASTFTFRLQKDKLQYILANTWTDIPAGPGTGGGPGLLTGTVTDRFQTVTVLDEFIFVNNGVNYLQRVKMGAMVYEQLGNAGKYKYITGFANRVVAANFVGSPGNGALVAWCGDANSTEWDPLVDESAGSSPLVDSPADLGDFIMGLFGFSNIMLILREHSIWAATKQPVPSNPFYFFTAYPGIGCDCPHTACITQNAITWVDQRTGTVWRYTPGTDPIPIGRPIEKDMMKGISSPDSIFASYDPISTNYTVCLPQVGTNSVKLWTHDTKSNTWVTGEAEGITCLSDIDFASAKTTINALGKTPINSLRGPINSLSPVQPITPARLFGRSDGEILIEDENTYTDVPFVDRVLSTGKFTTELISKSFTLPEDDQYFCEVRIGYVQLAAGSMKLYYSKDGGVTWNTKPLTVTRTKLGVPLLFRLVKQIKTRRFAYKLTFDDGQFSILDYEVHAYKGATSNV